MYSEKATNFLQNLHRIFVLFSRSTVEILQNFVAFSEYMNFIALNLNIDIVAG